MHSYWVLLTCTKFSVIDTLSCVACFLLCWVVIPEESGFGMCGVWCVVCMWCLVVVVFFGASSKSRGFFEFPPYFKVPALHFHS